MDIEHALQRAEQALASGQLTDAEKAYRIVLSLSPDHPVALRGLGLVAEAAGDLDQAIECINTTIERLDPSVRHAIRIDLARLQLKKGLERDAVETLISAAEVFVAAHRLDEAGFCLRNVLNIDDSYSEARHYLSSVLHTRADLLCHEDGERARALAEEAYALNPDNEMGLRTLVKVYAYHGPEEKRLALLDKLVAEFDTQAPPAPPPSGLREVHPSTATAQEIASSLLSDGAILVRGLLNADGQSHFLSLVEQRWLRDESLIFANIPKVIVDAMEIIFGRPPRGMTTASNVRTARIEDDQSYLFYHQDLTPLCIMGINLWAALDPIDGTRPGLEVLVRRQHRTFPVVPGHIVESSPYRIPDEAVRGVYPEEDFAAPQMEVGDGMLFLFTTVHRSHLTPEMTKSRRNAELRFI